MKTLECNICYTIYDENVHAPRMLQCGHTLCNDCIGKIADRNRLEISCPFCKKVFVYPEVPP